MYYPPFPIEPTKIVGGCIALYENIWDNPLKDIETIETVVSNSDNNIQFSKAETLNTDLSNQSDKVFRTNKDLSLSVAAQSNDYMRKLHNKFFDLVFAASSWYRTHFGVTENWFWEEHVNVLKYQTGEHFVAHYDGNTLSKRSLSPIVYLNDDYTGGELEFVNQNITIKPTSGLLALFPANYAFRHIAHPVKTGTKYAMVTWLHDRP